MTGRQILGHHTTVVDVLRAASTVNAEVEAYVEAGRRLAFAQWDQAADGVAALFSEHGVGRGDVVCLMLPSSIDYALCYQAAARLGAVTTGVNARLGASEQASIVARIRPKVTVVDDEGRPGAPAPDRGPGAPLPPGAGHILRRSALAESETRPAPRLPTLHDTDPVAIVWTSGTTGVPKGAVFDHRNLAAVAAGTDVLSRPGDRRLNPLPFAHVGYMTRPWDEIANAVTTVITPQPWTAEGAISMLQEERVTVGQGVPTQWALVLAHPDLTAADVSHLRIAATGGSRVAPELVRAMRDRLGCPVVVRYTSTETSLGTGTQPGDPDDVVATTVGRPVPGVELELVADDNDEGGHGGRSGQVAPGAVGRVRLRSAATMRGYVGDVTKGTLIDAGATSAVVDDDGWVTTGDLGYVGDDGNLRLVGRAAEMYIRGGYNVYPAEVEAVLGSHPAIDQVTVVGVPDPVLGEIGVAFVVVPAEAPAPELAELRRWVSSQLADYKAPDRLHIVSELPVTAMVKVDRRALAALAVGRAVPGTDTAEPDTAVPNGVDTDDSQPTESKVTS